MKTNRARQCFGGPTTRPRDANGFSLVELLIVLALMIIMVTAYWGFGSRSNQQTQRKACQKNLQGIYVAMQIFANDNWSNFPMAVGAQTLEEPLGLLVPKYTSDTAAFICPGSKDSTIPAGELLTRHKISYAYYMGWRVSDGRTALLTDKQVDTQSKTTGQPLFSSTGKPPGNNHHKYGGNILFCDGSMELSSARADFPLPLTNGVVLLNPKP